MKKSSLARVAVLVALVATVAVVLAFVPVKGYLTDFLAWVQDIGPWGPAFLAIAYVPAAVLFLPGSILTLGAGFAFGVIAGSSALVADGFHSLADVLSDVGILLALKASTRHPTRTTPTAITVSRPSGPPWSPCSCL